MPVLLIRSAGVALFNCSVVAPVLLAETAQIVGGTRGQDRGADARVGIVDGLRQPSDVVIAGGRQIELIGVGADHQIHKSAGGNTGLPCSLREKFPRRPTPAT